MASISTPFASPVLAAPDAMRGPALRDVRLGSWPAEKMHAFIAERMLSRHAQRDVFGEARLAFKLRDDDWRGHGGVWRGEFWGKLMLGTARVAQYLEDPALIAFVRDECHRLMAFQDPDGYLGSYADKTLVAITDPETTRRLYGWCPVWNIWNRKYAMWGMLEAWRATGDESILDSVRRQADQLIAMLARLGFRLHDTGTFEMNGLPSMSILKPMVLLYEATGEARYLDFARDMLADWDRDDNAPPNFFRNASKPIPLREWYPNPETWAKSYELMSCLDGLLEYHRATGDARCLETVFAIRDNLDATELNPLGSVGYGDKLCGGAVRVNALNEVCDAIHWIRLNLDLYLITGDRKYVDAIEMTYCNAFLAGVFRDGKWGAREVRSHGRHVARFGQSGMRHQHCCVNNMPRTFMDVAQLGVTREAADGALRVNLYSPSTTTIGDATVVLTGEFPVADRVTAMVEAKTPQTVKFRLPPWSKTTVFRRLPDGAEMSVESGDWHTVQVPAGVTAITVKFDMTPRLEDSDRAPSDVRTDYRYGRWNVGRDTARIFRTTPAARLFRGPLLLAKAKTVGDDEADILRADLNKGGWKVKLRPFLDDRVMGAWEATFTRGTEVYKTNVCDFPSAGDSLLPIDANAFSIFF